jgi:hypothetical protein
LGRSLELDINDTLAILLNTDAQQYIYDTFGDRTPVESYDLRACHQEQHGI